MLYYKCLNEKQDIYKKMYDKLLEFNLNYDSKI